MVYILSCVKVIQYGIKVLLRQANDSVHLTEFCLEFVILDF